MVAVPELDAAVILLYLQSSGLQLPGPSVPSDHKASP